jgi:hypothetical protein
MNREELIQYIQHSRKAGADDENIIRALTNAGWNENDVKLAMKSPATFFMKNFDFRSFSLFKKSAIILMIVLFLALIMGNVYIYKTGEFPFTNANEVDILAR